MTLNWKEIINTFSLMKVSLLQMSLILFLCVCFCCCFFFSLGHVFDVTGCILLVSRCCRFVAPAVFDVPPCISAKKRVLSFRNMLELLPLACFRASHKEQGSSVAQWLSRCTDND